MSKPIPGTSQPWFYVQSQTRAMSHFLPNHSSEQGLGTIFYFLFNLNLEVNFAQIF